jgi:hypothetical protein
MSEHHDAASGIAGTSRRGFLRSGAGLVAGSGPSGTTTMTHEESCEAPAVRSQSGQAWKAGTHSRAGRFGCAVITFSRSS